MFIKHAVVLKPIELGEEDVEFKPALELKHTQKPVKASGGNLIQPAWAQSCEAAAQEEADLLVSAWQS